MNAEQKKKIDQWFLNHWGDDSEKGAEHAEEHLDAIINGILLELESELSALKAQMSGGLLLRRIDIRIVQGSALVVARDGRYYVGNCDPRSEVVDCDEFEILYSDIESAYVLPSEGETQPSNGGM